MVCLWPAGPYHHHSAGFRISPGIRYLTVILNNAKDPSSRVAGGADAPQGTMQRLRRCALRAGILRVAQNDRKEREGHMPTHDDQHLTDHSE